MKHKVNIWPMYHPAAALHQPRLWAVMLQDWEFRPEHVNHNFIVGNKLSDSYGFDVALDTENDASGNLGQWSVAYRNQNGDIIVIPQGGKQIIQYGANVVMHNAKWDIRVLERAGMNLPSPLRVQDTMIASYCLGMGRQDTKDTGRSGDHMVGGLGLKYLARRHLGMEMRTWKEVEHGTDQEITEYNANDSVATYLLWEKWNPQLPQHYWDIDMPLLNVLMTMENRGIMVDPNFLQEYATYLSNELDELKQDLPLNPYSPDQVAKYVYETLSIQPTKFTGTGKPSVDKEILETIDDPIVKQILKYKEFYKEKDTYVDNYISRMGVDNRIHCEFKQTSTATGRLSSANPNLQNVSEDKTGRPSQLKALFIAQPDCVFVRVDYKQLELRVFAAVANEEKLLEVFRKGGDPHQETADFLDVSRSIGKNINFLMLYGGTPWRISQEFHVPIDQAKQMLARYYGAYPNIKKYHTQQIEKAHNDKVVYNWFGRKRRLDSMFSDDWRIIKEGEREAINTDIQGTSAEIVKRAMIRLHYDHHAPMLIQVHDELLFEIPKNEATDYARWLYEYLPTLTTINGVSFDVDVGIGKTWADAKKEELFG